MPFGSGGPASAGASAGGGSVGGRGGLTGIGYSGGPPGGRGVGPSGGPTGGLFGALAAALSLGFANPGNVGPTGNTPGPTPAGNPQLAAMALGLAPTPTPTPNPAVVSQYGDTFATVDPNNDTFGDTGWASYISLNPLTGKADTNQALGRARINSGVEGNPDSTFGSVIGGIGDVLGFAMPQFAMLNAVKSLVGSDDSGLFGLGQVPSVFGLAGDALGIRGSGQPGFSSPGGDPGSRGGSSLMGAASVAPPTVAEVAGIDPPPGLFTFGDPYGGGLFGPDPYGGGAFGPNPYVQAGARRA